MYLRICLLFFLVLSSLTITFQAFGGPNANAVLSLDLIIDGGACNRTDDGVVTGTVSGVGQTIAVEVFATGVNTSLIGVVLKFDFDASLLAYVKAENSSFALTLPEGAVGTNFASSTPVTLPPSGFLARAEFETTADVTDRTFSIGIDIITLAESTTSSDVLTTSDVIMFNAVPSGADGSDVLSLDLISDGGEGDRIDDGVTSGAVSGRGQTIAIEVFAADVNTSLIGMVLKFDFDASLLEYVKAENSSFPLSLPEGSVGTNFASSTPVTLPPSGFLARAEFETISDVTGREFSIGIDMVTLAESTTASDVFTTNRVIRFNSTPSPDFDGDGTVGFSDFLQFASRFGVQQGNSDFDARFDLDGDGEIGFSDFLIFARNFGKVVPTSGGGSPPDLVLAALTVSNNALTPGQSLTLNVTVRNRGNGPAVSTMLRYYRSADATISRSDMEVGTGVVTGLPASGTVNAWIRLSAPSIAGTYYYGACVDTVTDESDTGNNCSAAVSITVAAVTPPASGASKLYWTDWGTDKIQRANLDGSDAEDLVVRGGLDGPDGLAVDMAGGKMYWTDAGASKIQRANLDGSNVDDLVTGLGIPYGLALDISNNKMYWTDRQTSRIQRANVDGSGVEDLITSGLVFPGELELDLQGGKMYWTNSGSHSIQRSNLDGSGVEDLIASGLGSPTGLGLDLAGGKMYWTDRRTDKIQRANLDGSGIEDLVTSGLDKPNGLALDVSAAKMYWADAGTDKIQRADLDGSGVEDLVTGADGLIDPSGVAVGGAPSPFRIELVFIENSSGDGFNASKKALFHKAAARWMSIITGDIPDSDFSDNPIDRWDDLLDARIFVDDTVDDLRVFVGIVEIDGAEGTLGRGGTRIVKRNRDQGTLVTKIGVIAIDRDDLEWMSETLLSDVILHEMGHVLGFGTLWETLDLVRGESDVYFTGRRAIRAFDDAGGRNYSGPKVPVESDSSHWRGSVFGDELMTASVRPDVGGSLPLSAITIQSLADHGYPVDVARADMYMLPSPASAKPVAEQLMHWGDCIAEGPIYVVDENGRIVDVVGRHE
ncbi:MAG: hypothetical protein OYM47_12230 [Gemmatimonadota bacterium]|nr:hypothetical protein [Gemmatimonadota bacterium]